MGDGSGAIWTKWLKINILWLAHIGNFECYQYVPVLILSLWLHLCRIFCQKIQVARIERDASFLT